MDPTGFSPFFSQQDVSPPLSTCFRCALHILRDQAQSPSARYRLRARGDPQLAEDVVDM